MNWYTDFLYKSSSAEIHPFDYDNWDEYQDSSGMDGIDTERVINDAEESFKQSHINLDRNKDINRVVILDGKVIGAISSSWNVYDNIATFAFDMAIKPEYRGDVGTLFKMIKEGIDMYDQDRGDYEDAGNYTEMSLWVVNRKLIPVLGRYGFEVDEDHGGGGATMSYRG
jgi:hypothetical protein